MPIIFYGRNETRRMVPQQYQNDAELLEMVALHPDLLQTAVEAPLALVQRNINLFNTGLFDLLLVDSDGRLVIVKVKLDGGQEPQR
jgi:hypothetical protein